MVRVQHASSTQADPQHRGTAQRLITDEEYEVKRRQILDRL